MKFEGMKHESSREGSLTIEAVQRASYLINGKEISDRTASAMINSILFNPMPTHIVGMVVDRISEVYGSDTALIRHGGQWVVLITMKDGYVLTFGCEHLDGALYLALGLSGEALAAHTPPSAQGSQS